MDPAGSYDNGSFQVMNQVYPFLMNFVPGTGALEPDIAQRCAFSAPTTYNCVLKPGLKFANGHDLTSSDVKFSLDRERVIDDPNGPQSLLANLEEWMDAWARWRPDLYEVVPITAEEVVDDRAEGGADVLGVAAHGAAVEREALAVAAKYGGES